MAKPFKELLKKMRPEAQELIEKNVQALLQEMPLQALRQARNLSQVKLAELLDTQQNNISRMERRTDVYISTLRNYIEAMGGHLDIVAKFPEGDVHLNQFKSLS